MAATTKNTDLKRKIAIIVFIVRIGKMEKESFPSPFGKY